MKKFLADLIKRLTSRKFLLAVGGSLTLIANQQWQELTLLIGAYIAAEGGADVVERYRSVPSVDLSKIDTKQLSDIYNEAVDTGAIEPGSAEAL